MQIQRLGHFTITGGPTVDGPCLVFPAEQDRTGLGVRIRARRLPAGNTDADAHGAAEEAFHAAARTAAALRHPHLAPPVGSGTERTADGLWLYVVTLPFPGPALADPAAAGIRHPPAEAVRTAAAVLDGLSVIHAAGLAHGAVGPGLVSVGADGRVVLDGLSLALAPRATAGTAGDLDAVAALVRRMLGGHGTAGIPAGLAAVLDRAATFPTAAAFAHALGAALPAGSAAAQPAAPRRVPRLAAAAVVAALLAAGAGWHLSRPEPPPLPPVEAPPPPVPVPPPAPEPLPLPAKRTAPPPEPVPEPAETEPPAPAVEAPPVAEPPPAVIPPPSPSPESESPAPPEFPAPPAPEPVPAPPAEPPAAVEPEPVPPPAAVPEPPSLPAEPPAAEPEPAAPPPPSPPPPSPPPPSPPPPSPEEVRARLAGALEAGVCGLVSAAVSGETLTVSGTVAGDDQRVLVQDLLDALPPPLRGVADLTVTAASLCPPLQAIAPFRLPPGAAAPSVQSTVEAFTGGDDLVLSLTAPGVAAHIQVDYFTIDGTVVHLLPNPLESTVTMAPGAQRRLGERRDNNRYWEIAPPYGHELVVLFASPVPLFPIPRRAETESADSYLTALREALSATPGAMAVPLFITTRAPEP